MSQLNEAQESLRDCEHQMRRSEHRGRVAVANEPAPDRGTTTLGLDSSRDELVSWWGMVGEFSEFMVSGWI